MSRTKAQMVGEADRILEQSIENVRKVFDDEKAPATSRASAVSSALKIYEILKADDLGEKQASEMTYEELQASIAALRGEQVERQSAVED